MVIAGNVVSTDAADDHQQTPVRTPGGGAVASASASASPSFFGREREREREYRTTARFRQALPDTSRARTNTPVTSSNLEQPHLPGVGRNVAALLAEAPVPPATREHSYRSLSRLLLTRHLSLEMYDHANDDDDDDDDDDGVEEEEEGESSSSSAMDDDLFFQIMETSNRCRQERAKQFEERMASRYGLPSQLQSRRTPAANQQPCAHEQGSSRPQRRGSRTQRQPAARTAATTGHTNAPSSRTRAAAAASSAPRGTTTLAGVETRTHPSCRFRREEAAVAEPSCVVPPTRKRRGTAGPSIEHRRDVLSRHASYSSDDDDCRQGARSRPNSGRSAFPALMWSHHVPDQPATAASSSVLLLLPNAPTDAPGTGYARYCRLSTTELQRPSSGMSPAGAESGPRPMTCQTPYGLPPSSNSFRTGAATAAHRQVEYSVSSPAGRLRHSPAVGSSRGRIRMTGFAVAAESNNDNSMLCVGQSRAANKGREVESRYDAYGHFSDGELGRGQRDVMRSRAGTRVTASPTSTPDEYRRAITRGRVRVSYASLNCDGDGEGQGRPAVSRRRHPGEVDTVFHVSAQFPVTMCSGRTWSAIPVDRFFS